MGREEGLWNVASHLPLSRLSPGVFADLKAPQSGHLDFWLSIRPSGR